MSTHIWFQNKLSYPPWKRELCFCMGRGKVWANWASLSLSIPALFRAVLDKHRQMRIETVGAVQVRAVCSLASEESALQSVLCQTQCGGGVQTSERGVELLSPVHTLVFCVVCIRTWIQDSPAHFQVKAKEIWGMKWDEPLDPCCLLLMPRRVDLTFPQDDQDTWPRATYWREAGGVTHADVLLTSPGIFSALPDNGVVMPFLLHTKTSSARRKLFLFFDPYVTCAICVFECVCVCVPCWLFA